MSLNSLIRKAKKLIDLAEFEGEGKGNYYYSFKFEETEATEEKEVKLTITTEEDKTKLTHCTCLHHTFYPAKSGVLCSYFLAVLFKMEANIK